MSASPTTLHEFRREPNAVSHALAIAGAFVAAEGLACGDILAVIIEEVVCNLVEHGIGDSDDRIELALSRTNNDGVRLALSDGCIAFDPRDAAPVGEEPPERGGGSGLALVRAWARSLSYERRDGRNYLELVIPC
jgi:serine/threonine-protein kinase RsbW